MLYEVFIKGFIKVIKPKSKTNKTKWIVAEYNKIERTLLKYLFCFKWPALQNFFTVECSW